MPEKTFDFAREIDIGILPDGEIGAGEVWAIKTRYKDLAETRIGVVTDFLDNMERDNLILYLGEIVLKGIEEARALYDKTVKTK